MTLSGCISLPPDNFHEVLSMRKYDEAKEFINKGADVNEVYGGGTPLCFASRSQIFFCGSGYGKKNHKANEHTLCDSTIDEQLDMVRLLIKNGAKINAICSGRMGYPNGTLKMESPLVNAVREGFFPLVELLIANGAKVDATNANGTTPLMFANGIGHTKMANLLLKNGANPSRKDKGGNTAYDYYMSHLEFMKKVDDHLARQEEEKRRDKAESREMWKGIGTLATGMAVGNATRNLAPDQQTRMMRSSMNSIDSGDASEFIATTNQVKAERAQEHQAKMRAIEAQKDRDARKNMQGNSSGVDSKSQANSSGKSSPTLVASNQRNSATANDGAANQEAFKPAFTYSSDPSNCHKEVDDLNRPYRGRSLSDPNYKEPPFYCAWEVSSSGSSSASEQSQECSKAKQQILFSGKGHEVVKDFGCGCSFRNDVGAGLLSCGYYMILKRPERTGSTRSSGGKSK